jgi:hypothetical protein
MQMQKIQEVHEERGDETIDYPRHGLEKKAWPAIQP